MTQAQAPPQEELVFTSEGTWPSDIGHAIALYCSDPWYEEATRHFLDHLDLFSYDQIVKPSGPAIFLTSASSFVSDQRFLTMLYERHQIRRIVAVAHYNCTYYKERYPQMSDDERVAKQRQDLLDFRVLAKKLAAKAEVELYYARQDGNSVNFTQIN